MVDTVKSRPNFYEVLGLKPTASGDEIAQAFAREISAFRPRPIGGLAEVTVAYKTLRDPARRRAYDDSLGLNRVRPVLHSLSARPVGAAFVLRPPAGAVERSALATAPRPDPVVEPVAAPFIAAPSRDPVKAPLDTPPIAMPEPQRRPQVEVHAPSGEAEEGSIPWKRTGIAAVALVGAVALAGAWAGWNAGAEPQPANRVTKLALPPPTTFTISDAQRAVPAAPARAVQYARPQRINRPTKPRVAAPEQPTPAPAQADPLAPQADASEQTAQAPVMAAAAASLPLPNRVIARTIHRIGYPCGQVASTAAVEGAAGAFKVTCTSGHSYQAAPVRGRYHFRRLGGG